MMWSRGQRLRVHQEECSACAPWQHAMNITTTPAGLFPKVPRQECSQRCAKRVTVTEADQFAGHCDGPNLNLCVLAAGFQHRLDFQKRHLQRLHERFHRRLELVDDTHCDPLPLLWVSNGTRRAPFQFLLPCAKQSVVLTVSKRKASKTPASARFDARPSGYKQPTSTYHEGKSDHENLENKPLQTENAVAEQVLTQHGATRPG